MSEMKVLFTNSDVPQSAVDLLLSRFEITINQDLTRESVLKHISGMDAVHWATKIKLDKEMLDAAGPQLKVIGVMAAGLDHVDVPEFKNRGIKLSNTPSVLNGTVADMTVLLILAASRRVREGRLHIENNTWVFGNDWMLGQDVAGSTVGIVGFGGIGQTILKKLKAFDVTKFVYTGHKEKKEGAVLGAEFVSLDELLRISDFVIVSCPLTPETRGMFNEENFSKMKNTAVFVNVARGEIVDQPALVKALKQGTIFAAGLDVMTPEPLPNDHELLSLPNCVLVPHLGSATLKTRTAMAELAANNIILALDNKPLLSPAY